ncbi:MAG: hypothetical protein H7Y02_04285 [Candidatus Obscuribacterales bacterium]|nr:hypothetical protein [Steroidobacteraceae bacterium]
MKRYIFTLLLTTSTALTPALAVDLGVSVSVGQPGFYGHIDIGDYPRPRLVFAEPIVIHRVGVMPAPMYLHVPPGHAKDWKKHCARYDACGRPVYFVQESWYNDVYVPRYQERHGKAGKSSGKDHGKDHSKGNKNK